MRDSVPSQQRDERVTVRLNQECVFIKAMQEGGDEGGELQSDRLGGASTVDKRSEPACVSSLVQITSRSFVAFLIFYLCTAFRWFVSVSSGAG